MHLMLSRHSGRDIGEDIFACENSEWPPTLSSAGHMHKGTKSEIVKCLESEVEFSTAPPIVDVLILDGAFIVHMLKPGIMSTFKEYADQIVTPYILACLQNVSRLDVVWDIYKPDSLKFDTRQNRGDGVRQRVTLSSRIPGNWHAFLRVDANKSETVFFLSRRNPEHQG